MFFSCSKQQKTTKWCFNEAERKKEKSFCISFTIFSKQLFLICQISAIIKSKCSSPPHLQPLHLKSDAEKGFSSGDLFLSCLLQPTNFSVANHCKTATVAGVITLFTHLEVCLPYWWRRFWIWESIILSEFRSGINCIFLWDGVLVMKWGPYPSSRLRCSTVCSLEDYFSKSSQRSCVSQFM